MIGHSIQFCTLIFFNLLVVISGRHSNERDYCRCPQGQVPIGITNADGFLDMKCMVPRCEEFKKYKPVCSETFTNGCPKGCWVSEIHREWIGKKEKAEYKTKCCSHPIFQRTIAILPQPDFEPGQEARDAALGQGDTIDLISNVLANSQFDHHSIEVTKILCHGTTTSRPSTLKPKSHEHSNENQQLHDGDHEHYNKQPVPRVGKPPPNANDPKAWGLSPHGGGTGCFSADTLLHTRYGIRRMDQIQVGDEVLSSVSWDGNSAVSYQPITQFIHKDPNMHTKYTVITTESGRFLSLTPLHLLPQFDCHLLELSTASVRQYEILFTQSAKFAKRARPGQCVLVVDSEGKLVPDRISNVTTAIGQGVYSPITASGIIVANGVQASCYSSIENHAIQHAFFSFVHKISQACRPYLEYVGELFGEQVQDDGQIPYLLRATLALADMVMTSF